jgi:hypothetical protein
MSNSRRGTNIIVMNIKKKVRQYRSNQGRSPKQQESNEIAMFVSGVGFIIVFGTMFICSLFN